MSISRKVWMGPPDELVKCFKVLGRRVEVEEHVDFGSRGVTFEMRSGLGFDELPPADLHPRITLLSGNRLYVCFTCPSGGDA